MYGMNCPGSWETGVHLQGFTGQIPIHDHATVDCVHGEGLFGHEPPYGPGVSLYQGSP